jgi:hypothetical protein
MSISQYQKRALRNKIEFDNSAAYSRPTEHRITKATNKAMKTPPDIYIYIYINAVEMFRECDESLRFAETISAVPTHIRYYRYKNIDCALESLY